MSSCSIHSRFCIYVFMPVLLQSFFFWPFHLIMCRYLVDNFVLCRRFCMQRLEIFSNVSPRFCFIQVATDISSLSNHRQNMHLNPRPTASQWASYGGIANVSVQSRANMLMLFKSKSPMNSLWIYRNCKLGACPVQTVLFFYS
ncbi:C6 transcription factor [Histoplasma capsulatum var. duboisii H88]|uniref:C6 transcription factor n=1 Tax=Ajellomyces capsulatus (strain H88) TaxID=544711 RepID=A0A8A1L6N2_AJEC8|nr:C6 transcription factor [Histoplasma capsulatum var. duboisii H88]